MPLTLDQIVEHEERLRREIVGRECLLAAFKVLHGYAANGQSPESMELSSLVSTLLPPAPTAPLTESASEPATAPTALPTPAPVKPYVNPELIALGTRHGSDSRVVQWAIQKMTDDYTLRDIQALLEREGCSMPAAKISVVLTRLKSRGEIEEIKRGGGRTPSVYRKPENTTPSETKSADSIHAAESTTESALAP
jgi:hypothetical protein